MPYSPSTASRPWASNCRTTPRHSASDSSSPIPNTDSWSWSNWMTFAVLRPSRMSMIWPAPNFWPRSRFSRTTVDSSFCAATVPSQVSGGVRQVSQLPQPACLRLLAEVRQQPGAAAVGGLAQGQHRVEVGGRPDGGTPRRPRRPGSACAAARRPGGRTPSRPWTAARRGPRGPSPGSSPRRTSAGRGGRRTARPACRCPCRTRSSPRRPGRPRAGTAPGGARARPGVQTRVVRHGLDAVAAEELGRLLRRVAREAVDDARVPGVLLLAGRPAAASWGRPSARSGTGCWAGRSSPRSASRRACPGAG